MNRVSVIIPCYRDSTTLARALLSLERQTRQADEIIVVDDCSPEGPEIRRILESFPQVKYVRNATNLGLAGTRNQGLSQASGDVVAFLDADDEAHPQRLEWQLRHVGPRQAVACDVAAVQSGGLVPPPQHFRQAPIKMYRSPGQIAYFNRLTGASLMAPTELLRLLGGYDQNLRACEDFDLWLRLLADGVVVCRIRLPLYIYHHNPSGLSQNYKSIGRWELEVVEKFVKSGRMGGATSWKVGTVWSVWLARQFARAEKTRSAELFELANSQMHRLLPWPFLQWAVRAMASLRLLGLYRFVR